MKDEEIRQSLKRMAADAGPDHTLLAQVKSVNENEKTCDLYDDESGLDYYDVRLRPVLDGKSSITTVPKVDSWVLAIRLEGSEDWMVIACGEFQKVLYDSDETIINGGSKGGLVNWPDAKQQLDKTNEVVNALVDCFKNWTPVPNDGGAALKTFANTQLAGKTVGNFNDLEDTKVKH